MKIVFWTGFYLCRLFARLLFRARFYGRENLIEDGPAIIASNHQSYLDPPLVGIASNQETYFLARKSLFNIPIIGSILPHLNTIPVDPVRGELSSIKAVIRELKSGHRVLIFPEGTRSTDGKLGPARAGVGMIVAKSQVPVVPVRVFGTFEALPKQGGLKLHSVAVVVGKPIHFTTEELARNDRDHYQQLSERIMAAIAALELPN